MTMRLDQAWIDMFAVEVNDFGGESARQVLSDFGDAGVLHEYVELLGFGSESVMQQAVFK